MKAVTHTHTHTRYNTRTQTTVVTMGVVRFSLLTLTLLLCLLGTVRASSAAAAAVGGGEGERGKTTPPAIVTVEGLSLHASTPPTTDEREWFLRCVPQPQRREEGEAWRDASHPQGQQHELRTIIPVVEALAHAQPKKKKQDDSFLHVPLGSHPLGAWHVNLEGGGGRGGRGTTRDPALTCSLYDVNADAATASVSSTTLKLSQFLSTSADLEFTRLDPEQPERRERWLSLTLRCDACHEAAAAAAAAAAERDDTVRWELMSTDTAADKATWKRVSSSGGDGGEKSGEGTSTTVTTPAEHSRGNRPQQHRSSEEASAWTVAAMASAAGNAFGKNPTHLSQYDAAAAAAPHHKFPWRFAFFAAAAALTAQSVLVVGLYTLNAVDP
jgi:hypothetical protein